MKLFRKGGSALFPLIVASTGLQLIVVLPRTATQLQEKRTIIQKITPEDLGDAEDKMTMGDLFQNLSAHPFVKLNHSLLVAGRTEVSALAGEDQ